MENQMTFKRYEMKFLLNPVQKEKILACMNGHMQLDRYGRSTIRNIYFDTDNYELIRHSMEKPVYKEKMRIRSYKKINENEKVFVELKKKYDQVVYKRRILCVEQDVKNYLYHGKSIQDTSQIGKEIQYFWEYYKNLCPKVFLSYDREAYYSLDNSDFRVTFDENILYRTNDLSLESDVYGTYILENGMTLMEIKTAGGIPLWLSTVLSKNHIYKTSYSKYGAAYIQMKTIKEAKGGRKYA